MPTYLINERLNLIPQLILALMPIYVRKRLVNARGGGVADIGDQVGEILGALQLDAALDLGDDGVGVHGRGG